MFRQEPRLLRQIITGFVCTSLLLCANSYAKKPSTAPAADQSTGQTLFLPKARSVPGGLIILDLPVTSERPPKVEYQQHRQTVIAGNIPQHWRTVIGLNLTTQPGKQQANVTWPISKTLNFTVKPHHYPRQKIWIKQRRKVSPLPEDLERIKRERKTILSLLSTWSDNNPFTQAFIAPTRGRISSKFGLKRLYNGKTNGQHSGIDIAVAEGTPVKAAAGGIVLAAKNFFYTGNTIFLDHGRGLITLYCHLDSIAVTPGRHVSQGSIIGTVGRTGRATGPHLHWTVVLNHARINPFLLVNKSQFKK